jgi:hypothetical protein
MIRKQIYIDPAQADHQLCLDLGNSGKMGSKMPIRPISHPERDADPNERAVAH